MVSRHPIGIMKQHLYALCSNSSVCFGLDKSADKGLPVPQMKGKVAPIEAYFNPQLWQNQY